ncbi:MFS transporter [Levilactobacillus brevis]|uniref:MFS transporter n=1 Tax=Levilactobacillus brevis TaxID=1580 RepID=UPI000B364871|nr:MFS transporter [Levilactobacillus brevis]
MLSIIESSVGFGALLYALATISGGHWFIIGVTLLIGIIGIVLFVRRQLAMDDPMLNLHVFQSPMFTLTTVLSSLSNMALLGMQLLVPLYLQSVFQIPALTAGLVMIPGALMMAIVNPIAGMIFDRSGIEKMSLVGFTIFTLATIPFVIMTPTWSLITVTLLYAIWMAGISLIVMQLGTAGINALPSELVAHGNGVNTMARQIGASIGTALLITISTLGSQMSHATTTVASSLFGYRLAFLALVILSLLGLIGTFWLRKASRTTATVTA